MKWKILSSSYLFNDQWLKVRKDRCETPGGKIVDPYYVYEFTEWVAAVPVTEDGRIVMIRQYRHAYGDVCLEFPGGCVDEKDGDYETAIRRELLEETGYSFSTIQALGVVSPNPSTNNNLMHMFLATGGKKVGGQNLDHGEEIEVDLFTMAELRQLIRENKIVQSMHVSCYLYAMEALGERL